MLLILLLAILFFLFVGAGFAIHFLWIAAVIVVICLAASFILRR